MSPELNGGIRLTLKAHAVCGMCTECADIEAEDVNMPVAFFADAKAEFERQGWEFKPGFKVRCPTCKARKKPARCAT